MSRYLRLNVFAPNDPEGKKSLDNIALASVRDKCLDDVVTLQAQQGFDAALACFLDELDQLDRVNLARGGPAPNLLGHCCAVVRWIEAQKAKGKIVRFTCC
jgi:hypothetical protein